MYNNNPTNFRIQRGEQRGQIVLVCVNLVILSWSHNPLLVAKGNVGAKAQGMSQYFPLKEALRHHVGEGGAVLLGHDEEQGPRTNHGKVESSA